MRTSALVLRALQKLTAGEREIYEGWIVLTAEVSSVDVRASVEVD